MAWNRSNEGTAKARVGKRRASSLLRGLVAGTIVAAGAAVLFYFFLSATTTQDPNAPSTQPKLIKEVKPQLPQKTPEELEKEAHPGMVKVRGKWYPEYNKAGGRIWISKNWVRYHSPVVYTNSATERLSRAARIFTNYADRELADLITVPLGSVIIGDIEYGPVFVKQFLESCKTPVIATKDDDEWTANVKKSVNEAKIELMERYNAGEDIAKIMTETRRKLKDLGIYKLELMKTIRESVKNLRNDPEQTKDVYDAANLLLAERGIAPIKLPTILKNKLKLNDTTEKKAENKE